MNEQVNEYIKYLLDMRIVKKPQMPSFDIEAYTDSEYEIAISQLNYDFEMIDDFNLTLDYLQGE